MHDADELADLADVDVEVVEEAFTAADRLLPTAERDDVELEERWWMADDDAVDAEYRAEMMKRFREQDK